MYILSDARAGQRGVGLAADRRPRGRAGGALRVPGACPASVVGAAGGVPRRTSAFHGRLSTLLMAAAAEAAPPRLPSGALSPARGAVHGERVRDAGGGAGLHAALGPPGRHGPAARRPQGLDDIPPAGGAPPPPPPPPGRWCAPFPPPPPLPPSALPPLALRASPPQRKSYGVGPNCGPTLGL
jgi:hypothetical protein